MRRNGNGWIWAVDLRTFFPFVPAPSCSLQEAGGAGAGPRKAGEHHQASGAGFGAQWAGRRRGRIKSCSPPSARLIKAENPRCQGFKRIARPFTARIGPAAVVGQKTALPAVFPQHGDCTFTLFSPQNIAILSQDIFCKTAFQGVVRVLYYPPPKIEFGRFKGAFCARKDRDRLNRKGTQQNKPQNTSAAPPVFPLHRVVERKIGRATFIVSSRFSEGKEKDIVSTVARLVQHSTSDIGRPG